MFSHGQFVIPYIFVYAVFMNLRSVLKTECKKRQGFKHSIPLQEESAKTVFATYLFQLCITVALETFWKLFFFYQKKDS